MRAPILILLTLLLAATASADPAVQIRRIDESALPAGATALKAQDCFVGNLTTPVFMISDRIGGAERYRYSFWADPDLCNCTEGFTIDAVHMYMKFGTDDVPVSFDARGVFDQAEWNEASGAWVPGAEICSSPVTTIEISGAGMYDIFVEMAGGGCACAAWDYHYAVGFDLLTNFNSSPDMVVNGQPLGGQSWVSSGGAWNDLLDGGLPGEICIYADATCCENPTSATPHTFGAVKSLYR